MYAAQHAWARGEYLHNKMNKYFLEKVLDKKIILCYNKTMIRKGEMINV